MRVAYHTFGCKTNQYDTERIRQELEARGAESVSRPEDAELVVVNTCTVTHRAESDARRLIRRVRRRRPGIEVLVVGCSAAVRGDEYRANPEVGGVVEGHDPVVVAEAAGILGTPLIQIRPRNPDTARTTPDDILLRRTEGTRGWLKIQDGCDRNCSFCATRIARGASRSRDPDEILREARALARVHPELVLTGIHIGHYGRDLKMPVRLSELVRRLLEEVPGVRFRLGSVEATEIDDLLLDLLSESSGGLAPHLHMPLQSGANAVLRRMRRWHTREDYRTRALEIVERTGVLGLGADLITGFPGETEADHRDTVRLIEELPYTYLHVFPFSAREGTTGSADARECPVPQRVAGERARELRSLAEAKGLAYRRGRTGGATTVVVEDGGIAMTEDYLRVRAPDVPHRRRIWHGTLRWADDDLAIDLTPAQPFN